MSEAPIVQAIRDAARSLWWPPSYEGSDPDTYVRWHGVAALRVLVAMAPRYEAPSVVEPAAGARLRRARIQRREVERLSPAEQDRRMDAMLANLDTLEDQRNARPMTPHEAWLSDGVEALKTRERRRAEVAERARIEAALAAHRGAYAMGEDPVSQATRYLAPVRGGVSGQGRDNAAFDIAVAMCRGFALDESTALDLLLREYSPKCSPPWPRPQLLTKVRRAAKSRRCGLGYLLRERRGA